MNPYYCYVEDKKPVVKEERPKDFDSLPFYKFYMAPSLIVAGMI